MRTYSFVVSIVVHSAPPVVAFVMSAVATGALPFPRYAMHFVVVAPEYSAIVRASRVEGIVVLEAVIGEDGAARDVRVLRSVPLLDAAAIDAVRQVALHVHAAQR